MRIPLAASFVALMIASSGCASSYLSPPPAGYGVSLTPFLQTAPLDPPPANTPVVTLIYTLPGTQAASPLEIRPTVQGKLPPWTTIHPLTGPDVLARKGLYVGVFSPASGKIRYLARIGDPRDVLGEWMNPKGAAALTREGAGTYSVRVPFLVDAVISGFEVDAAGTVSNVQFYLPLSTPPPVPDGFSYKARHD